MPPVVVDTREQQPYQFPGIDDIVRKPLDVGDYTHEGFEDVYSVERKSLDDLASSLSGDERLRFENEIRRANGFAERNDNGNPLPGTKPDHGGLSEFVVVVEADREQVEHYSRQAERVDESVRSMAQRLRQGQRVPIHLPYLTGIHPNAVLGTVDAWPERYDELDFLWAGDRSRAKQETLRLLDKWYLRYGGST